MLARRLSKLLGRANFKARIPWGDKAHARRGVVRKRPSPKEVQMTGKSAKGAWITIATSAILLGGFVWIEAGSAPVRNVPVKALFLDGNLPGVFVPNKILNDSPGVFYQSGGGNSIFLGGADGHLVFSVDAKSGRHVDLHFDSQVVPPGTGLKDYCGIPYFLTPVPIVPIPTTKWRIITSNECVMSSEVDADGYRDLLIKGNALNFLTMSEGQVAYAYVFQMDFYVADSKLTQRNDSRDMYILQWEPNYVKVIASGWDGAKVNSWTITPITEKFKHMKGETADWPVPEYYLYPEGTVPRWLFSNAIRSCFHGIHNLPYELRIIR